MSGRSDAKDKAKNKGGGGLFLFLLYGVGCAVGGAYVDRNHLSSARLWVGSQVQSLQQFGAEQAILGSIDKSGLSGAEKGQAREDVVKVYEARRGGRLSDGQMHRLVMAEVRVERAASGDGQRSDAELRTSLAVLRGVAEGL